MARFCLECGTALEKREYEGRLLDACPTCDFVRWPDPKLVTITIVETGEGIVAGRRGIEPGYGLWCFPGGFVNDDEHPRDSARRECIEEIGADVEIGEIVGIYHIPKPGATGMVALAFTARLREGEVVTAGAEMLEVGVFSATSLPPLAFPSHREVMLDWLRLRESSEQGVEER